MNTPEQRFHRCLDAYSLHSDGWHRPLAALRVHYHEGNDIEGITSAFLNSCIFLAVEWNNNLFTKDDPDYIEGLTEKEAWGYLYSYCKRPFIDEEECEFDTMITKDEGYI